MQASKIPLHRLLAPLLLALIFLLPGAAAAQTGPKIGFANINRIKVQSETGRAARNALDKEFAPRLDALNKQEAGLRAAQAAYEKDAPTLSAGEREQRERALQTTGTDLQRKRREYAEDYETRDREFAAEFNGKVAKVVIKVAVAERYDMMFQEAVWWSPAIDITDKIIKELDAAEAAATKTR